MLAFRSFDIVDGIQIGFRNIVATDWAGFHHGGGGGTAETFTLLSDEYITAFEGFFGDSNRSA